MAISYNGLWKRLIALCALLLVLFVPCRSIFTDVTDQVVSVFAAENDESVKVTVDRVVDGDTFVTYIDGEKTRVRMIGVDTPESVHADESRNTKWDNACQGIFEIWKSS